VPPQLNRRTALGLGSVAAAGVALGAGQVSALADSTPPEPSAATPDGARRLIAEVYQAQTARAGGIWNSFITVADPDGTLVPAVEDMPDEIVQAYSVNKTAVSTAVLDKIDRGLLTLDQRVELTASIVIADGDGTYWIDSAYPSSLTLGHVLATMLTISDDTCVRLCGLVCPALELNQILVAKGFPKTQVRPVANPNRFFLGQTTPRETHDMLQALVRGTLLSEVSTAFLLTALRAPVAFTDGIRRMMSSDERARIGTKAGWFADGRNEAGIMFDTAGRPVLTYAMFAHGQDDADNFGATHPAVEARAVMGRRFLDAIDRLYGPVTIKAMPSRRYHPTNGG
jgi:beta-lactamase class A